MMAPILLALAFAALALLLLAERLGVPVPLLFAAGVGLFVLLIAAHAVLAMTSQLSSFLGAPLALEAPNSRARRHARLLGAGLILFAAQGVPAPPGLDPRLVLGFLVGFFVALLLAPARAFRSLALTAAEGGLRKDSDFLARAGALVLAGLLLWAQAPVLLARAADLLGEKPGMILPVLAVLVALPALLGGARGLARLASQAVLLFAALLLAPMLVAAGKSASWQGGLAQWPSRLDGVLEAPFAFIHAAISAGFFAEARSLFSDWTAPALWRGAAYGAVLGQVLRLILAPLSGRAARAGALLGALLVASTLFFAQLWQGGPMGLLAGAAGGGTLAALTNLAGLAAAIVVAGFLLHAAASGLSELIGFRVFHPRALKAERLVFARLAILALGGALVFACIEGVTLPRATIDLLVYAVALLSLVLLLVRLGRLAFARRRQDDASAPIVAPIVVPISASVAGSGP